MTNPTRPAPLTTYRAEVSRAEILAPSVEQELALRQKEGDRDAGRRLVEGCLPYVLAIAAEYRRWGVAIEDLVQEGNLGLLKAVERFEPRRGVRFATYAAYWIRAEIREYLLRHYRIVRLGSSKGERRALRLYRRTREDRPEVLSAMSGLSQERVEWLLPVIASGDVSMNAPPRDAGSPLQDRMPDAGRSAEDALCAADEQRRLEIEVAAALAELPAREQDIVRRRLLTDDPVTLHELGEAWGVSRERVRQLEEHAKTRIRRRLQGAVEDAGAIAAEGEKRRVRARRAAGGSAIEQAS
jgi:RNA polymerase sigma-32 factor